MDDLSRSLLNTYSAQPLDRCSLERKDPSWLSKQYVDNHGEYLLLERNQLICSKRKPLRLTFDQFTSLNSASKPSLLGLKKKDEVPVFLVNITDVETVLSTVEINEIHDDIECLSLREITAESDTELAAMYSYAMMLNHWHLSTRFCTRCGSAIAHREGGIMQQCANESCSHTEYPRINPAVIMRVTKDDKILLARQESWPEHMYSVLAGFVEVGETLEHAVQREVMEEVKLAVENINYHSSQPWPFPNSLMLGYTAEATSYKLDFEQDDIEYAMWLTADEMKLKMSNGSLFPSSYISISYSLINDWFLDQTGTTIRRFKSELKENKNSLDKGS